MNRRAFLSMTAAATAGLALALPKRARAHTSPNDTVNVAIIGIRGDNKGHPTWTARGRGQDHYEHLAGIANVRITHVVDVDERHFKGSLSFLKEKYGGDPKTETDFRRVLDNRDVDAITIAAPDHWHALMTIWACQAGKDVYLDPGTKFCPYGYLRWIRTSTMGIKLDKRGGVFVTAPPAGYDKATDPSKGRQQREMKKAAEMAAKAKRGLRARQRDLARRALKKQMCG